MAGEQHTTRAGRFIAGFLFLILIPMACLMLMVAIPLVALYQMFGMKPERDPQKEGDEILRRFSQEQRDGQRSSRSEGS